MGRLVASLGLISLCMLLAACSGSSVPDGHFNPDNPNLPELDYDLITESYSTVYAEDVTGEMAEIEDALDGKAPSALPAGYLPLQGMYFSPVTPPGAGFAGTLTVRVSMNNPAPNEFDGVRLFLFYIDPATKEASIMDSSRAWAGNWVSFKLDAIGFFVIAENLAIPRPDSVFSASAFADLAQTTAGTPVNFWAVGHNGEAPYTFTWNFGDSQSATGPDVTHSYLAPGEYNVELIATDAQGTVAPTISTAIEVTEFPTPLTGVVVNVETAADSHLEFSYTSTISGGLAPYQYEWDFDGDGATDSTDLFKSSFVFPVEGLYGGSLAVTDALGDSASASFVSDARLLAIGSEDLFGDQAPFTAGFSLTALGFAEGDLIVVGFGDGSILENPPASFEHTYENGNTYFVQAVGTGEFNGIAYETESNILALIIGPRPAPAKLQVTQPLVAIPSQALILHGFAFGAGSGLSSITYNGEALDVIDWTETAIEFIGPNPAQGDSGELVVLNEVGDPSLPINLVADQKMVPAAIQNVIPPTPAPGGRVLVVGHGFGPGGAGVSIAGEDCIVEKWGPNAIAALVPATAALGPAVVQVNTRTMSLAFDVEILSSTTGAPSVGQVEPQPYEMGIAGTLTLSGTDFGTGYAGLVLAEGQVMPYASWGISQVVLGDPPFTLSSWGILVNQHYVSNPFGLIAAFRPVISAVEPPQGSAFSEITIIGSNFGVMDGSDNVSLAGVELIVKSWTDTQILASLPGNVVDGDIVVATEFASNPFPFDVIPPTPGGPGGGQI